MSARAKYLILWVLAVVVATAFGLFAVRLVGEAVRGSGPIGQELTRAGAPLAGDPRIRPDPDAQVVRRAIAREFGTFVVACHGAYAVGERATPAPDGGWAVLRFEPGPDDDVDAVFTSRTRFVELEVFCNAGRPEVSELESSRVTDD